MDEQTNPVRNFISNGAKENLTPLEKITDKVSGENNIDVEAIGENSLTGLTAALESLLFIYGEPIAVEKAAKLLEVKAEDLKEIIDNFEAQLKTDVSRGLMVSRVGDRIQLATKPNFHKLGEKIVKEEIRENLTPAALETLSIVAYSGPIARSMVDYLRGVNSTYILRHLLVRGLIERYPDQQRPYIFLYNVSFNFMKHLGLAKQEELPEYPKYKEILKNIFGNAQ